SGMFVWTVESIIKQFRLHLPEMAEFFEQITDSVDSEEMDEKIYDVYSRLKSTSIDYGVMEVAENVSVIEANYEWNDVGSWEAVFKISEKDENGNGLTAALNMALDSKNNYIYSPNKLVALVGVDDLVVVETDDALLVCKRDQSQNVKEIVDRLKRKKLYRYL
ncbi:MAG: mannose-1-phosphate guanylyltransferase, partial [Caldithrix sp.]|nr:mannose-1-phosphate guanylyltransferase [Caldithrix sp.]